MPVLARPQPALSRSLWLPVTVRVAWELVMARVKVRPAVLADAREHVLRCLPLDVSVDEAETLAVLYTHDYLDRVRHQRYRRPSVDPDLDIPVSLTWRKRVLDVQDRIGEAVFRLHYGDTMPLEAVEQTTGVDRTVLAGAREGIRETLKTLALLDQVPVDDWAPDRLDRLLRRLANLAEPGCPGPVGLISGAGQEHADRCPRCSRAVRLLRGRIISPNDLFAPKAPNLVPDSQVSLLAVLLHPDAHRHRRLMRSALGPDAQAVDPGAWLMPAEQVHTAIDKLIPLCEQGQPPRHHIRGARIEAPGRISRGVMLGPAPVHVLESARSRPWGEIEGASELPPPLPPPPKATAWWLGAGAAATLAIAAVVWVGTPTPAPPATPIEARFADGGDGWQVRFDTPDLAVLDVVLLRSDGVQRYGRGLRAGKGHWATGEGDYLLRVNAQRVSLIASPEGIDDLDQLIEDARTSPSPLDALASAVRARDPRADIVLSPPRPPTPDDGAFPPSGS